MKTLLQKTLPLLFTLLLIPSLILAGDLENLKKELDSKIQAVMQILENTQSSKEEQDQKLLSTIEGIIDFDLMANISLSRKHREMASKEEYQKYITLFTERIKRSYLDKMHLYSGEKVEFGEPQQPKPNRIQIPAKLVGKGDPIGMEWKYYLAKDGKWRIYDLDVSGVSIIQTYRTQFAEILQNSSFEEFLNKLQTATL